MTEALDRAVAAIERLPTDVQDAIAARLLAEVEDEEQWAAQFAATTDDQWDRLADAVRREVRSGTTIPLENVIASSNDA